MKLLDDYFKLQKEIYEYFGYVEDWVVIPLDDETMSFWRLDQDSNGGGVVYYSPEYSQVGSEDGDESYSSEIYTQRFLPKWVYRAEEYTMICIDTHTDGNRFLTVFDNSKEVK